MLDTVKKYGKLALVGLLLALAGYGIGRYAQPAKVVTKTETHEVKVRDEEYTRQQVTAARAEWERTSHTTTVHTVVVTKPCPPPTTEPYECKPPCATDCSKCPSQTVSDTTTTDSTTHEGGSTNTNTTTTDHGTSHTTDTTNTTTTTTTTNGAPQRWTLALIADATVFDGPKLSFTPTYGAALGYKLFGPLDASLAVYTDKSAVASLSLDLGKNWYVSADAGSKFNKLDPFYGGTVGYHLFGPVWVSAWGTSQRTAGISARFQVR